MFTLYVQTTVGLYLATADIVQNCGCQFIGFKNRRALLITGVVYRTSTHTPHTHRTVAVEYRQVVYERAHSRPRTIKYTQSRLTSNNRRSFRSKANVEYRPNMDCSSSHLLPTPGDKTDVCPRQHRTEM